MRRYPFVLILVMSSILTAAVCLRSAAAESPEPAPAATKAPKAGLTGELKSKTKSAIDRGTRFLRGKQTPEGRWQMMGRDEPGLTALALTAFFNSPRGYTSEDGPFIRKPLEYIASLAREDGGIYDRGLANYVTCVAVMALEASGEEKYKPLLERARSFLVTLQADEGEGYAPSDKFYGGAGYGSDERPDLSNMSLWMEGMRATGASSKDEAVQKAMKFLNRCQNHSETNTEEWKNPKTGERFVSGNDGGAAYFPGMSYAGYDKLSDGRLAPRSYGSMTYALLKCYLFAGVKKDDPRMKAAIGWVQKNFGFEENPGFDTAKDKDAGYQGLYYFFYTAALALDAYGEESLVDGEGIPRKWREELAKQVLSLQREDGSWVNDRNDRWWEGEAMIATCYALLTLEICYGG